jgi:hypothetical protein
MKNLKLLEEIQHPKGNIPKGAVCIWNELNKRYEYEQNNIVLFSFNLPALDSTRNLFEEM